MEHLADPPPMPAVFRPRSGNACRSVSCVDAPPDAETVNAMTRREFPGSPNECVELTPRSALTRRGSQRADGIA